MCSATAAASSYPRGRPGRSSSTARASITEQLIERTEQTKNLTKKRASTARPSITEQLMERTDKSRMPQRFVCFFHLRKKTKFIYITNNGI